MGAGRGARGTKKAQTHVHNTQPTMYNLVWKNLSFQRFCMAFPKAGDFIMCPLFFLVKAVCQGVWWIVVCQGVHVCQPTSWVRVYERI